MLVCYLDEHASERLTEALVGLGLDATSANRLQRKGLSDALHLLFAAESNRVLVTYDVKDFTLLHEAWHHWIRAWGVAARHAGILLIYSTNKPGIDEVAEAIDRLSNEHADFENRAFSWKRGIGWTEVS